MCTLMLSLWHSDFLTCPVLHTQSENSACIVMQLCAAIWKWSITHETNVTNLGDWCKDKRGEESDKFYWVSRTSDCMLTHFQLFSEVCPAAYFSHICHTFPILILYIFA